MYAFMYSTLMPMTLLPGMTYQYQNISSVFGPSLNLSSSSSSPDLFSKWPRTRSIKGTVIGDHTADLDACQRDEILGRGAKRRDVDLYAPWTTKDFPKMCNQPHVVRAKSFCHEKFIVPKRIGGLGNQLFQVAAAAIVAKRDQACLILQSDDESQHEKSRKLYLQTVFRGLNSVDKLEAFAQCLNYTIKTLQIPTFEFKPVVPVRSGITRFEGYAQNSRYFSHDKSHGQYVRHLFRIPRCNSTSLVTSFPGLQQGVAIHVRRGDFVTRAALHLPPPTSYFVEAFSQLQRSGIVNGTCTIFLFSDDPDFFLADDFFRNLSQVYDTVVVSDQDPIRSFWMISLCSRAIICSNSTFCWWAAFLRVNPVARTIFPKKWIAMPMPSGGARETFRGDNFLFI